MVEILKQGQYAPLPVEKQILITYAGTSGLLDDVAIETLGQFELALYRFAELRYPDILKELADKKEMSDDLRSRMDTVVRECKAEFQAAAKAA
jgi:F-type H+-transporting ATPase subunit alpha